MKILQWIFALIGIAGLITVRFVENEIFYDPFLNFFKVADKQMIFPAFDWLPLVLNYIFRFAVNTFFSLIIIHSLFLNKKWTAQGFVLIAVVFAITLPIYLFCVYDHFNIGYLFSFYMRRFVIQPLMILLIVPLFYYRKQRLENGLQF